MSNESFDFDAFIADSKNSLTNPKAYFGAMKTDGGMVVPLVKAVLYGAIAGIISFIWSLLKIGAVSGGLFGGAIGFMVLIWALIGAIIGLFIGAVIVLILSAISGGNTDFEPNVRVTASLMVLMPINALFGFASGINIYLGAILSLAVNLFGLWMLYHALNESLKAKEATSKVLMLVLAALAVLLMFMGFKARKTADNFLKDFEKNSEEFFDEYQEDLEDAAKDFQEAAEDILDEATDEDPE